MENDPWYPNFEQNHKITWMQNIAINIINIWPVTHRIFMISLGAYIFWHQSRSMIQRQGNAQAWHAKGIGRKTAFTRDGSRLCWNTKLMDTIGPIPTSVIHLCKLKGDKWQTVHTFVTSCKSQQNSARFNAWCISDSNPTSVLRFVLLTSTPSEASAVSASFSNLSNESHQLSSFSLCHHHLHHLFIASPTLALEHLWEAQNHQNYLWKKKHDKTPDFDRGTPHFCETHPCKKKLKFPWWWTVA